MHPYHGGSNIQIRKLCTGSILQSDHILGDQSNILKPDEKQRLFFIRLRASNKYLYKSIEQYLHSTNSYHRYACIDTLVAYPHYPRGFQELNRKLIFPLPPLIFPSLPIFSSPSPPFPSHLLVISSQNSCMAESSVLFSFPMLVKGHRFKGKKEVFFSVTGKACQTYI